MKIIQTFWTGNQDCKKESYGWLTPEYHYISWILSCNQLRKFYDDVILFTDKAGYDILINQLQLPYSDVIVCLDQLNSFNPSLWAIAKIKTYSMMEEPFIHIDGDVFIWDKIDNTLGDHDLIVQNVETPSNYYGNMWKKIRSRINYIPNVMKRYDSHIGTKSYNMGIFGGNDINFIKKYCNESFQFVNKNIKTINDTDNTNFNIFFEQFLLCELATLHCKDVVTYISDIIGDNEYQDFANFEDVPDKRTYLHLLGSYKKHFLYCNRMRTYVIKHYPEYFHRLENIFHKENKVNSLHLNHTEQSWTLLKEQYTKQLINNNIPLSADNILIRDVISLTSVRFLQKYLESGDNFYIIPTFGYNINEKYIEIKQIYNETIKIEKLFVDDVIFSIIKKKCDKNKFNERAVHYIENNFSIEQIKGYINFLWKRIYMLTLYGLFIPMKISNLSIK